MAEARYGKASPSSPVAIAFRNYRALIERTVDVFGDELTASRWLSLPSPDFDGQTPLQVAQAAKFVATELERRFEPVFIRIEHGIYS